MTSKLPAQPSPWAPGLACVLICVFLVLFHIANAISYGLGQTLSPQVILLGYVVFYWLMGYWFVTDCRAYKISWGLDSGMFLYILWPLVIPVHLFKTRGIKGVIPVFILLGVYLGAYLVGLLVFYGLRYVPLTGR